MVLFFHKWWSFLFPVQGWRERVAQYKAGRATWPSPVKGKPDWLPWPPEWQTYSIDVNTLVTEQEKNNGFALLPGVCTDTGKQLSAGCAFRCARCGVPVHAPDHVSFPACIRCRPFILLV